MQSTSARPSHTWRFFRAGGFDQVRIDSGADLRALDQLDQKLWVALACPTTGLEFDLKTLELIDSDKDGRIRVPELLAAVKWTCGLVKNADELLQGSSSLALTQINDATAEGKAILASARQILLNLGKGAASSITLEDVSDTARIFGQTSFNGDGIIPVEAAEDAETRAIIQDVIACVGSRPDRSGRPGIDRALLDQFFVEAKAHLQWCDQSSADATIMPLGAATADAAAALAAVRHKIDDYFARCKLAEFDSRAQAALNRQESEYLAVAANDLTITAAEVRGFPLARIEAGKPLPLDGSLNPAWADAMASFNQRAVKPLLGQRSSLTAGDWAVLTQKLSAYIAWTASKTGPTVEKLGQQRLRQIVAGDAQQRIAALIDQDQALEPQANAIATVEKLLRYNRDLCKLLNNFVSFRDFYLRKDKAVFQAGTLYLDQRSCDLCVAVPDMARHATLAHLSHTYLVYCDLTRRSTGQKMLIAAAFTAGDSDNLMVGRNGIFYDRQGNDWDATVIKIVDNPISIRQAFWAPYKRVLRLIEDQVAKRAAAADAAQTERLSKAAMAMPAEPAKPQPAAKLDIGVVAALGVAVGGITAAMGALLQAFFGLGIWMPLGLLAIVLLISGPAMVIAALKLRQRNLGPILDANGWALNAKARISIPFGTCLTATAALPRGSKRDLHDLYAKSRRGRTIVILAIVVAALLLLNFWYFGLLERVAPGVLPKSEWLRQRQTPVTQPIAPPRR